MTVFALTRLLARLTRRKMCLWGKLLELGEIAFRFAAQPPIASRENAWHYDGSASGAYQDRETNLAYNMMRDYDPAIGRYVESDPIGLAGGSLSPYVYVNNNPLGSVDPTGLQVPMPVPVPPIGGTAGGAGGNAGIASGLTNLINKIIEACKPDDKPCPPCRLVDGTIVPVGTVGYRLDTPPPGKDQHGIPGPHLNLYKANQNPNNCQCFWQPIGTVPPPPQPDWIPIQPFAN